MIHNFTESDKLFGFLVTEQHYRAREIGISKYHIAKIARRMNVLRKQLDDRIAGRTTHFPPTLTKTFARELDAEVRLIVTYGLSVTEFDYDDAGCREAYRFLNQLRVLLVRAGRTEYTLDRMAESIGVGKAQLSEVISRGKYVFLEHLVRYANVLSIKIHVQVTHDFEHTRE